MSYALDNSLLHAEEEAKFSEVALVFVNHCVEFIRKHRYPPFLLLNYHFHLLLRHFVASDPEYLVQLEHILKCLNILETALRKCNSQVWKMSCTHSFLDSLLPTI